MSQYQQISEPSRKRSQDDKINVLTNPNLSEDSFNAGSKENELVCNDVDGRPGQTELKGSKTPKNLTLPIKEWAKSSKETFYNNDTKFLYNAY